MPHASFGIEYLFHVIFSRESLTISGIQERKAMMCVWWCNLVIIHSEFLNHHQTFNVDLYSLQLQCMHKYLQGKRHALVS